MSDRRMVPDAERLPWLADDPMRVIDHSWRLVFVWAVGAALLVAAVSFWMGLRSQIESGATIDADRGGPAATVTLPEPEPVPMPTTKVEASPIMPQVAPPPTAPAVEPIRARPIAPAPERRVAVPVKRKSTPATAGPKTVAATTAKKSAAKLRLWSPYRSDEANGRVVRLGTFASRSQAKLGWRKVIGVYPGLRRLPAVVVPVASQRNGKTYYRLQMGTTSQAHSTVVCQWMRMIGQGCVVVGLPKAA